MISWNPDPVFFTIPIANWPVRWYGLSWLLAFVSSNMVMAKIFKTEKRPEENLDTLTLYIIFATVIGARLGHCLFYDTEKYLSNPLDILKIWEGGLASHGAAVGIITAVYIFCRRHKENVWWLWDRMMIVASLASFFIRFGNFMNSEIVGRPTDASWAIIFTRIDQTPRHPAQLYEGFFYLLLFFVQYHLWKKKRHLLGGGFQFGFQLAAMFSFRFFIEFLKESQAAFENGMMINMGQILSIPFVVIGVYLMRRSMGAKKLTA